MTVDDEAAALVARRGKSLGIEVRRDDDRTETLRERDGEITVVLGITLDSVADHEQWPLPVRGRLVREKRDGLGLVRAFDPARSGGERRRAQAQAGREEEQKLENRSHEMIEEETGKLVVERMAFAYQA